MSKLEEAFSQLRDALIDRQFLSLEPDYYTRAHGIFRSCTNEHSIIVDWLSQWIVANYHHTCSPISLAILSIGCGDGSIDAYLADYLLKNSIHQLPLIYVGIEPNSVSASAFMRRLDSVGSVSASVIMQPWPQCAAELDNQKFDFILFVHSLYHVENITEALEKALRLLKPHGELIVVMTPYEGLGKLSATIKSPQHNTMPSWWAETVEWIMCASKHTIKNSAVLNCRLNLSLCRDETSFEGKALLDFLAFVQLPDDIRRYVLNVLTELKNEQPNTEAAESLIIDYSVHVWVLHQSP